MKKRLEQRSVILFVVVIFSLSLWLRLCFFPIITDDIGRFFLPAIRTILEKGSFNALRLPLLVYTPLFEYFLVFASWLVVKGVPVATGIKITLIGFDYGIVYFVYRLMFLKYGNRLITLLAVVVTLFAPTHVLNASYWGQLDGVYTLGLIATLYYLGLGRPHLAMAWYGFAFFAKMQAIFLSPFLLVLLLKRKLSIKHFLWIPTVYVIGVLPAFLAGRPLVSLLLIYFKQVDVYHALSCTAQNFYSWFPNTEKVYETFRLPGMILGVSISLTWAFLLSRTKLALKTPQLIFLALLSVTFVPFFLPMMHDRYFFPADILSIVYGFYFPEYFFVPILINVTSFINYFPYLFRIVVVSDPYLAMVMAVVLVYLGKHLSRQIFETKYMYKI